MEVWILLAAAGSGYLARRWQNSQKPKGTVPGEIENDNNASTSTYAVYSRGRYRRFSSSGRRQVGKSACGKGTPDWVKQPSKRVGNISGVADGDRGKTESGEGHICDDDDDGCQICIGMREASGDPTLIESGLEEGNLRDYLSHMRLRKGYEMRAQGADQDKAELEKYSLMGATKEGNILSRPLSGKRASESFDDKALKARQVFQDGYTGKRMKDALKASEGASVFDSWMPGFWDVSEGVFVLDTESLLVQHQGARSRGSSSSRKSRTPIKNGRGKLLRKKNLTGQKPMSSLESCLSAQLDEDYARRATPRNRGVAKYLADKISSKVDFLANDGKMGTPKAEFAIGLPSLSRQSSSRRLSCSRISGTFTPCGDAYNPFAGTGYSKLTQTMAGMDEGASHTKGRVDSSVEGILFNFGVGVGMMFTVMSNMHEVRRLTSLLREAESLIRDLEDELEEAKEGVVSDSDEFVKRRAAMHTELEQRRHCFNNTLRKVKSATESLSTMRGPFSSGSLGAGRHVHSKDMSKLEAELEAELERMELNLGEGDEQKLPSKNSGSSELDGEVGSLVQGELTSLGLPHEVEVESDDDDSSSSSQGDLHSRNYAVSPRALAKRLHEVLEARQEQQISELEAELALLRSKLQVREEEILRLKERPMGVLPALGNTKDRVQLDYEGNKDAYALEGLASVERRGSGSQIPHSPNASPGSPPHILPSYAPNSGVKSWSRKGAIEDKSTAYITLGGEAWAAYKEACDEFSKLSGDFGERHDGIVKDSKHVGNSDGLEQVDLISLAQDFYGTGYPEFFANMPAYSGALGKGKHYLRRKSRKGPHPEPEHAISSSRGFDSSDDATNDTSVSTPCSVKFMDVRMVGSSEGTWEGKEEEGYGISIPPYCDWSQDVLDRAGVNSPNREETCSSIHSVTEDSSSRFISAPLMHGGDLAGPDDTDYYSELDEQLGQLLIKRIVEKSRKGSPIVQDAHTALASLERRDRLQAPDEGGDGNW